MEVLCVCAFLDIKTIFYWGMCKKDDETTKDQDPGQVFEMGRPRVVHFGNNG